MIKKTRDLSREANILYELNHPSIFYHKNHNQKIFNDLKIYTIYIKLEMKMHYNKKKKKGQFRKSCYNANIGSIGTASKCTSIVTNISINIMTCSVI